MIKKKVLLVFLVLVLLITGCSRKDDKSTSIQKTKGRYMENVITLPETLNMNSRVRLIKKDSFPFLYVLSSEIPYTITGYQLNSDGNWIEATPEWMKSLTIPSNNIISFDVSEDAKGNQYLIYVETIDDSLKGNLLRSTDGTTYEALHLEGWEDKDPEYGLYDAPLKFAVIEDGTLVALLYNGKINFYNKEDQKIQYSITRDTQYSETILSVIDQSIVLGQLDNNSIASIDVCDISNNYNKTSYPYQSTLSSYTYLDINEDKDLILCNADGIHVLEQGTTLWQTIVDGTLNSLSMQTMWISGFTADTNENYYVLYNSNAGYSFIKYAYDETIDSIPTTELTIYSLQDNRTLRHAASIFQQQHPDVKVSVTIAMPNMEYETVDATLKDDYIRTLNTELLAGGGPDIIVLDGLPTDSLVEKGVLSDISTIIKPMIDSGELHSNIMNNYIMDNKIYYVPARFSLQLLCSRTTDAKNITTLDALAKYVDDNRNTPILGNMTTDQLLTTLSPFLTEKILTEKIMNTEGNIDRDKLIAVLQQLKIIGDNSNITEADPTEYAGNYNIWKLASSIQISLYSSAAFLDTMFPLGIVSYVDGSYTLFENSFIPSCELGVNKASSKQELSKEFLSLVLSEEIQKNDFYDGYPVNKQALILSSEVDLSNYTSYSAIENEDGSYSDITFGPLTTKQMEDLINYCSQVSNKAVIDDQIITALKEETKDFFLGTLSAEETADRIIEKTSVYLSE
jgi:ABC-type glycerol-3-phosphate transport system substrate-binding protein